MNNATSSPLAMAGTPGKTSRGAAAVRLDPDPVSSIIERMIMPQSTSAGAAAAAGPGQRKRHRHVSLTPPDDPLRLGQYSDGADSAEHFPRGMIPFRDLYFESHE